MTNIFDSYFVLIMQMTFLFAQLDDRDLIMERISYFLCKQPASSYVLASDSQNTAEVEDDAVALDSFGLCLFLKCYC
jgi:hypothetical protein